MYPYREQQGERRRWPGSGIIFRDARPSLLALKSLAVVRFDYDCGCDAREIPRPAGENAGLRDDALEGQSILIQGSGTSQGASNTIEPHSPHDFRAAFAANRFLVNRSFGDYSHL